MKELHFVITDELNEAIEEFMESPPEPFVKSHGAPTKAKVVRKAVQEFLDEADPDPRIRPLVEHYQWLKAQYVRLKALGKVMGGTEEYEELVGEFIGMCEVTRGAAEEKH